MRSIILVSGLLCGFGTAALANDPMLTSEPKYSQTYKSCMKASGGITLTMWDCLKKESDRWKARMVRAYGAVTGKLGPKQKKNLITAQQAWLRYRQTNCAYYASETGGTIDRITSNTCWLELTSHRAMEMERLLKKHIQIYGK